MLTLFQVMTSFVRKSGYETESRSKYTTFEVDHSLDFISLSLLKEKEKKKRACSFPFFFLADLHRPSTKRRWRTRPLVSSHRPPHQRRS